MSQIIKGHNKKIVKKETQETLDFNCTVKTDCPFNGHRRKESATYKCTAAIFDPKKVYLGLTEREFKRQRYFDHVKSFRSKLFTSSNNLSSYACMGNEK